MTPLEQLKDRARKGDADALRELRERGFFARKAVSYPVSDAQRRLWVLDQMAPASAAYNIPGALRITGRLDDDAFTRALQALVERHDSLRTRFDTIDGEPRQIVEPSAALPLQRADLSGDDDPVAEARWRVAAAAAAPFDLGTAPLLSACLYTLAPGDRVFAFTIHHIVADGWSLGVLFRELMTMYEAFARGASTPLEPLRLQYKDATAWQRRRLEDGSLDAAREFWLTRLGDDVPPLDFPRDFPRPAVQSSAGAHVSREIPASTVTAIEQLGAAAGATPFMTLMAAVRVFLLRYTGQTDIVIGTPVTGRPHPDLESQVGFYVNLLPLRTTIDPQASFTEVLRQVRDEMGAAYEQEYPFDRLVDELDLSRDMSRSPLFDVLVTLEEEQPDAALPGGLRVEPFAFPVTTAKYDLTVFFTRHGGSLSFSINYATALFRPERMQIAADHLLHLLESLASHPQTMAGEAPLASAAEIARVTEQFGRAPAEYPREASIAGLFESVASAAPDAAAVIFESAAGAITTLTYQQLNARADRVARALCARGVGLETPVGVRLERSERVAVALLGILKAGGCYVPLDTRSPDDRIAFMVADAGCLLVIDEQVLVSLESDQTTDSRPLPAPHGGSLAYVMYTSGSTGEPKGALIEQRSVVRLVRGSTFLRFGAGERILQTGSLAFDASTLEIWGPLLNGGTVCFAPGEDIVVASVVRDLVRRHGITAMWVTASLLNQWVDSGEDVFGSLRCVLTGGETLSPPHIRQLRQRYPALAIVNGYGPTENTTFTTCHLVDDVDGDIPIGSPIANTQVLILDERGEVCPVGVAGEICAAGDGIARGYLNRPELTAERFVTHPLADGGRLYRTGDRGRWRWDGVVEFLGRRDTQVKVRGYRIEPGEIEAALLRHPAVKTACVLARDTEGGTRELVAYVAAPADVGILALREFLSESLPAYMVPAWIVRLDDLPLTRNGKIDRAALPDPGVDDERRMRIEPPRTALERTLCAIWRDVLQLGEVGIRDNFFELGGHSLKATRVLTRMHLEISDAVTLRDLFAHPDIASLAARIRTLPSSRRAAIPRAPDGPAPASHAQHRLWLLEQLSGETGAYNVPGAVLLEGPLDAGRMSSAFTRLVARHESLRTRFEEIDGVLHQLVVDAFTVAIPVHDVSDAPSPEGEARRLAAADAQAPFPLSEAPLFRVALFRLASDRHVFFFNLHHVVTDAWSMRVLLGELLEAYQGAAEPPTLTVQYRDYAAWQRQELRAPEGQRHRQYWLDLFRDEAPALDFPSDRPRPGVQTFRGDVVRTTFDPAVVAGLRRLGRREGATLYTVLLALVRVLLVRHSGQEEFVLGTSVSGRDHADLDHQVGFFVNMLPLRQRVSPQATFRDVLRETQDTTADALEHQTYPFDLLVGELPLRREAGRQPLFDVVVTLDEDDDTTRAVPQSVPGVAVSTFDLPAPFSKFDLMFAFSNRGSECGIAVEYSTDLFDRSRIERLTAQLSQLVASVLAEPQEQVGRVPMLPADERRLLERFAGTATAYPADRDVASLFEEQAARTPAAIAVIAGRRELSYAELDARANRVAAALASRGIGHEDPVGVRLERSERTVVALLGILKASACYVPLEVNAPAERIGFMAADAGCRLVIDESALSALESYEGAAPARRSNGRSLAYVMYTSGSTGQPKGALIEHRSIGRLVLGASFLQLGPDDRMLQSGSIAFDASTLEIWGPLLNGGCVCLAPGDALLDAGRLRAAIAEYGATVMWVTASLFNQLVDADPDVFAGMRCVMTGGETLSVKHVNLVSERHPELMLLNGYGPTENTTFTTTYAITGRQESAVPIGFPLSNTTAYVVDSWGGLAPIGVAGEICTGGHGLARGYLNRPELTAERFVRLAIDPAGCVYRTGDVGRWRDDGAIEFIGRLDNQVKVHGYRVEPGEVEACLLRHPSVAQAAVVARETTVGTRELVAFIAGDIADVAEARSFLSASLPAYMVPSEIVRLAALPLNRNGKVDRVALLDLTPDAPPATDDSWAPPLTEQEQALAAVWGAVLNRARIGRDDHYFDSGGDSIRAIQIVNRLRKSGWSFDVRDLFQYPVLRDAALLLTRAGAVTAPDVPRGPIPLTPIQRWFLARSGDLHHFNHAVLLTCDGVREEVLRSALRSLVGHHLALRLAVGVDPSGRPAAMVDAGDTLAHFEVRDLGPANEEDWQRDMDSVQRGFDLAGGPLFRAVLYRRRGGDRLLLVAHHLIIDGVSWRIVLEDLEQAYAAAEAGRSAALTPQAHSYADWAHAVALAGREGTPYKSVATYADSAFAEITLEEGVTRALLGDAHAAFGTGVDDLLLASLARALEEEGQANAWVAMEGHGRDVVPGLDVGAAVGWFTSVFGLQLPADDDPRRLIRRTKETLRAAKRERITAPADCGISVNYMGQIDERAANGGRFALAGEPCGNPIAGSLERPHALEIGGAVRQDRLTLSATYDRGRRTGDDARRLLDRMARALEALVAYCRDASREPTPSDFAGCPLSLAEYDALVAAHGWAPDAIEDVFPLTPLQEGLLFESLLDAGSRAYFLQLNYRIRGPLDVDRFRAAWDEVARRHAVLRGAIVHEGLDRPLQVVLADRRPDVRVADVREDAIASERARDMARGVDLQHEPLMRMAVLRLGPLEHHVIWSYHHVLLDGWSLGVLYREFQEIYRALGDGTPPALAPAHGFAGYLRWLARQDAGAARAHWAGHLAGFDVPGLVAHLEPAASTPAGPGEHILRFGHDISRRLTETAAATGVTLNALVQGLWAILLSQYMGADDVAFGAVVSGRPAGLPGVEDMVGLFINTVPVRVQVRADEPLDAFLRRLQHDNLAAEPFHFFPLPEVQALHGGRQLFDHLLVFENYPIGDGDHATSGRVTAAPTTLQIDGLEAHDRTHYDLDLTIVPGPTIDIRFSYRADRVDGSAVARLAAHVERLALAAVSEPHQSIARLQRLPAADAAALLDLGCGPRIAYPVNQGIGTVFETQAAATPLAVAASHNGRSITYAELNARANQIAHWLTSEGVVRGDLVALVERRGLDLLASMLGTLKAGAAFVPVDPDYPEDRVRFMLDNSGARVVITRAALESAALERQPSSNPPAVAGPRDLAYVLYTSGSTGRPKGAQVRHDGALNHIFAEFALLRFHAGSAFLQSAPSSSDISVWQFLAPGLIGGRTVVADQEDVADAARLHALLGRERITICELVPVVMAALLDYAATLGPDERALPSLECAMVTGETVPVALVNQWITTYPDVPLVNAYGPTEAADDICQAVLTTPLPADAPTVPIGRPLANLRLYVLDAAQRLVPMGAPGEICVSGIGVGAGYWQDEAKTAASFVANPYADDEHHAVLYLTGDRGRWRADGQLECLGRLDHQVKIRGFRVELEEIEHRLLEHPSVRHAVAAVLTDGGDQTLVAWIVGEATPSALRDHLRNLVPGHMIPSVFVPIDAVPLTPAGKLDRRALPAPARNGMPETAHDAPATGLERQLADIWARVLQVPLVGRHDSFFDLGGHSLKAMQAVSRMHRDLGIRVGLQEFFARPTIAALAELIDVGTAAAFQPIEPASPQPDYELSHAQKRLWLLHHLEGQVAYNMPEAVMLDEPVDRIALARAFATLVERHEALRTAFVLVDGQPRQRILDAQPLSIREEDLTACADPEAEAARRAGQEAAVPFDLAAPPLLRAVLYRLTPAREVFLMVIHHIIGDGWSMNVLYREVLALYDAYRRGLPDPLAPLGIQYKDFAAWQNRQDMTRHEQYWLAALAGAPDRLALPCDLQPEGDRDFAGSTEEARIAAAVAERLRTVASARGTTVSNVVLAVFQLFLHQWTRQPDVCVGLAIAGRNRPELENLIGFFVNILPIRVQMTGEMEFSDLVAAVHARTAEAFEHQDYPFDLLVERLNPARQGNRQSVLNVIYAFQNFEDVAIDIGTPNRAPEQGTGNRERGTALVRPFTVPFETSKFDLTLFVTDMEGDLVLSLEYDTRLFRRETIRRAVDTVARFAGMVS